MAVNLTKHELDTLIAKAKQWMDLAAGMDAGDEGENPTCKAARADREFVDRVCARLLRRSKQLRTYKVALVLDLPENPNRILHMVVQAGDADAARTLARARMLDAMTTGKVRLLASSARWLRGEEGE